MEKLGIKTCQQFSVKWFANIFVGTLPFHVVLHVLDCFLSEGNKILYRVGLAILSSCKQILSKASTAEEFYATLENAASQMVNQDVLLKLSFGPLLRRKDFKELDEINAPYISTVTKKFVSQVYYRPRLDKASTILEDADLEVIWSFLPSRFAIMDPSLVFSAKEHGFNIKTMVTMCGDNSPTIILLKAEDHVFGCFSTHSLKFSGGMHGDGECFVFSLKPTFAKFGRSKDAVSGFAYSDSSTLVWGLSKSGVAIRLESEFTGTSQHSDTYDNPPFCDGKEEFVCTSAEAYILV